MLVNLIGLFAGIVCNDVSFSRTFSLVRKEREELKKALLKIVAEVCESTDR